MKMDREEVCVAFGDFRNNRTVGYVFLFSDMKRGFTSALHDVDYASFLYIFTKC